MTTNYQTPEGTDPDTEILEGISDIRRKFYRNDVPTLFFSATNFNLIGIDEWVRKFRFINYIDCFDGQHPNVFVPPEISHEPFTSIEDINNYLLEHPAVREYISDFVADSEARPRAVFLFFDERTEQLCAELGIDICFPPAALRMEVDDKISTTRIGNRAGIASVPNVLASVSSYEDLREKSAELGPDLVVQTAFGDSGHTTFFISNEEDYDQNADEITAADEVKIMKRIRCRGAAQEACVTRHGTIVGPLMTELVGFDTLTPYEGGWCGNEVLPESFSAEMRDAARQMTFAFGDELRKMGYRGYFELDYLRDLDSETLYLGEVNPRLTGASAMTNLAAFAQADAPLFLFHLLEWSGADFELDVDELNRRWADPKNIDSWSQLVIKHIDDEVRLITAAPPSGVWRLTSDGTAEFVRVQTHRRTVERDDEAFFLRISNVGDYFYEGADLGIVIAPGRMMSEEFELLPRAKEWIDAMRAHYQTRSLGEIEAEVSAQIAESGNFKMM